MDRFSISAMPQAPIGHLSVGGYYYLDVYLQINESTIARIKKSNPAIEHSYGMYYSVIGHVKEYYPAGRVIQINRFVNQDWYLPYSLRIVDCGLFKAAIIGDLKIPKTFSATCVLKVEPPLLKNVCSYWQLDEFHENMALKLCPAIIPSVGKR